VSPDILLPLTVCLLSVALAGVSLVRNPMGRVNRVYSCLAVVLAVWSCGDLMLRSAPDAGAAHPWQMVIQLALIALPAIYYNLVLAFCDVGRDVRPSLVLAYGAAGALALAMFADPPLLFRGVTRTRWGWMPEPGPLYGVFLLHVAVFFLWGLLRLRRVSHDEVSSFRRNRAMLLALGTAVGFLGLLTDLTPVVLRRVWPFVEGVYPVGMLASMLFALLLALSIVRHRLFDVVAFIKEAATYVALAAVVAAATAAVTWSLARYHGFKPATTVGAVVPIAFFLTLLLGPLGRALDQGIQQMILRKRRSSYQTLLDLSKRMGGLLDLGTLVDTLIEGLVRGVPLTHCVLLSWDAARNAYVPWRDGVSAGPPIAPSAIGVDHPLARWLERTGKILVKEEMDLDPEASQFFESAGIDLGAVPASLVVPLRIEQKLTGMLMLGEKRSGEIFDDQELEVLGVVATQAAVSLENARLYEELSASNARLAEASRLKSQFLASMSHELRTPLNSVIGFSKVLLNRLDGDLNERQEAYIRSVYTSSTHLLQLINGILDFSRSEAGRLELRPEDVDLHDLVDECIQTSLPLVRDKPVKVEKDLPADLPPVRADRTKVKQILLNLLSNAIKFTAEGKIVVRARQEPRVLAVSVSDTGIGIRTSDLGRLFEPFQRLDNPLAREAGGTGLGLTISKRFVELHGGEIWAESRENRGSTFQFTLPLT
jgi:signal transduction histidine kinase